MTSRTKVLIYSKINLLSKNNREVNVKRKKNRLEKTPTEKPDLGHEQRFQVFDKWFNTTLAQKSKKVKRSRDISKSIKKQRQKIRVMSPPTQINNTLTPQVAEKDEVMQNYKLLKGIFGNKKVKLEEKFMKKLQGSNSKLYQGFELLKKERVPTVGRKKRCNRSNIFNMTTITSSDNIKTIEQQNGLPNEDKSGLIRRLIKRLDTNNYSTIEEQPRVSVNTTGISAVTRLKDQKNSILSSRFSNQMTNFTTNQDGRTGSIATRKQMMRNKFSPNPAGGCVSPSIRNIMSGGETPFTDKIRMNSFYSPSIRETPMSPVDSSNNGKETYSLAARIIKKKEKILKFPSDREVPGVRNILNKINKKKQSEMAVACYFSPSIRYKIQSNQRKRYSPSMAPIYSANNIP